MYFVHYHFAGCLQVVYGGGVVRDIPDPSTRVYVVFSQSGTWVSGQAV